MPMLIRGERWIADTALPIIVIGHCQERPMNKDQTKGRIERLLSYGCGRISLS